LKRSGKIDYSQDFLEGFEHENLITLQNQKKN
jgi:hypothetical protein